jgi:hypothetical protein
VRVGRHDEQRPEPMMGTAVEQWPGESPALNSDSAGKAKLTAAKFTISVDVVKEPCRNMFQRGGAAWIAELTGAVGVPLAIDTAETAMRCQAKTRIHQFADKFTKRCLVLVPSHMPADAHRRHNATACRCVATPLPIGPPESPIRLTRCNASSPRGRDRHLQPVVTGEQG